MRIVIEYVHTELPRRLSSKRLDDLEGIFESALGDALAEWRQQNLARTDPADLPPDERAAVRAMMDASVTMREPDACKRCGYPAHDFTHDREDGERWKRPWHPFEAPV